jgi:DNA end-binding protein Ku
MDALQRSVEQTGHKRSGRGGAKVRRRSATARGRASKQKTKGGKSAESRLKELNKSELYEEATRLDISGRSKMSREQLLHALTREVS